MRNGINHNLFKDLLSPTYRKSYYELWLKYPKEIAKSKGIYFSENTPTNALREIFLEGIYNVKGFTPRKNQVVVDVGANFGDSAIWWSKAFGAKVVAFEPLGNVFNVLEENIKLNNADVTAYNTALGNGELLYGRPEGNMFISGGNAKIRTERLDSYSFDRVDILKVDVEGFEMSVLLGAENTIRKFKPRIIIETHSKELRKKCHSFLSNIGYSLKVEGRKIKVRSPRMDEVTNLFYGI